MLIPEIPFSEFKKLKASEIKELKSCVVTSDGEALFFAIIPPVNAGMSITDNIRTQAEYLGMKGNTVGGKELEQLKETVKV
ncbi:MAG: hypothetical protein PHQ43_08340 [Dehalococcoidales bacterium]|nr:hypothetical protein [Dehalococcoidales bacterium]